MQVPVFSFVALGDEKLKETYEKTLKIYKQAYGAYRNVALWPASRSPSKDAPLVRKRLELRLFELDDKGKLFPEALRLLAAATAQRTRFHALLSTGTDEATQRAGVIEYLRFLVLKVLKDTAWPYPRFSRRRRGWRRFGSNTCGFPLITRPPALPCSGKTA